MSCMWHLLGSSAWLPNQRFVTARNSITVEFGRQSKLLISLLITLIVHVGAYWLRPFGFREDDIWGNQRDA
jgi:hypothetical protein